MSSNRMHVDNRQSRPDLPSVIPPSPRSRISHPHFRPVLPIVESAHEQAVIDAGYPWVRTNPLMPTWMSHGADPRSEKVPGRPKPVLDRLNFHAHHGINTHLIVEGDLTLIKPKKLFGQDHIAAVTLSTDLGAPKELSVPPDEVYMGTTQQACKFVEGHRCLSPRSAHRYMSRGSLEWIDEACTKRDYVLEQLDSAKFETIFDFNSMRRVATCSFEKDNQVTRSMRQWFLREWNDPEVQVTKGDLRPAIHPQESPQSSQHQDHKMDGDDDEADSSGDELDFDDGDGSAVLTKAFQEWLQGGISEN